MNDIQIGMNLVKLGLLCAKLICFERLNAAIIPFKKKKTEAHG